MTDEFEKAHPILNEMAKTVTQLYEHRKNEETREQLLKIEHLLEEKLHEIRTAREAAEHEK